MADISGFDAATVEPNEGFSPIPAGDVVAVMTASEMKPTAAGTGQYLALTFEVIEGPSKNRKLFANLNLANPSQEAVRIARGDLSAICRAVGVLAPKDTSELHNKPLVLKVGIEKRKDTGDLQNRIKGYAKHGGNGGGAPAAPAASTGSSPWKR